MSHVIKLINNRVVYMDKHLSMQATADSCEEPNEIDSSMQDAMQQWLNDAQKSNDARDRIAVTNGVSLGVFGSLHLGASHCADASDDDFADYEDFKRAA